MFINNWSGVVLWENANRFCGSPDNSSTGVCTLVSPGVASIKTCSKTHLYKTTRTANPDYYDLCRWKTQNISLTGNLFRFEPAKIGQSCTTAKGCGFIGLFSEWGTDPSWSPYKGKSVEYHITFGQHNHFAANTYQGPWHFMALEQNQVVSWQTWRQQYPPGREQHPDDDGSLERGSDLRSRRRSHPRQALDLDGSPPMTFSPASAYGRVSALARSPTVRSVAASLSSGCAGTSG